MLSKEQIETNKCEFLKLINSIERNLELKPALINFLETSDFFYAPASTKYHCGYAGGLCEHSLNVYRNLCKLVDEHYPNVYSKDTLAIVSLLHDLSKTNFYELTTQNKKVKTISPSGQERYEWVSFDAFKVREVENRLLCGDHGFNSYLLISQYFELNQEEISAIINHHCGMDNNFMNKDLSYILNRFPLATLLHLADMLSTYLNERIA